MSFSFTFERLKMKDLQRLLQIFSRKSTTNADTNAIYKIAAKAYHGRAGELPITQWHPFLEAFITQFMEFMVSLRPMTPSSASETELLTQWGTAFDDLFGGENNHDAA